VQLPGTSGRFELEVPTALYDVQAIRERLGQVVGLRWAERLVVMAYPDERGHHLEVINLKTGFGALAVRPPDRAPPDWRAALYASGVRDREAARPLSTTRGVLFVAPAGTYDLLVGAPAQPVWIRDLEIPADRTRFTVIP
jgi:hypothetical protein